MDIHFAIEHGKWEFVAKYASGKGKYKGKPTKQIKKELSGFIKDLQPLQLDKIGFADRILDWLGI